MKGRKGGPDLSKVAAEPEHTTDWLSAHVRNAKAHKADSRMPAFGPEKISEDDLKSLVEFLASLK
jgi:cbb3-type cytochrome oxidase cytochrome c subunit